jgi:tetratricopeptide (TPR) repeat protein
MPTHIDVLCGDYQQAMTWNLHAIHADEKYLARAGSAKFYTIYRCHDYHFRLYAAMFAGQSKTALETVGWLEASLPEELLRAPRMADFTEAFAGMRVHALVRFGMWQDLLDLKVPLDQELYCNTTALIHYGKGVAAAVLGKIEVAEQELKSLTEATKRVPKSRMMMNNTCSDVLAIANAMLKGELEYRRGNFDEAFEYLQKSIDFDEALPYDEPWGWMQPPRHAYGALLLEQGHVEKAAAMYKADLGLDETLPRAMRHPNNVWALHGYHECLERLGRTEEARAIEPKLKAALDLADISIKSSCLCRTETLGN